MKLTLSKSTIRSFRSTDVDSLMKHCGTYSVARKAASARVLEKAGYEFEGRLRARYFRDGEYIDGLLYAKVGLPR